jgi:hypothetical protein
MSMGRNVSMRNVNLSEENVIYLLKEMSIEEKYEVIVRK